MFDIDLDYNDRITSFISICMILFVIYNIYDAFFGSNSEGSSPMDYIYNLVGYNTDKVTIIDNNIKPDDDTDSEEDRDITSNIDTIDNVLKNLPSQINKNICCNINKTNGNDEGDDENDDDDENNDDDENDDDENYDDENDEDENDEDENDEDDEEEDDEEEDNEEEEVENDDKISSKLDDNNKLRMRKINFVKKQEGQ